MIELHAPAKLNLALHVLAQETSGYHALETLLCAVSLHDTIQVRRGGGEIDLQVHGEVAVGPLRDNLVVRAARRFYLELGAMEDGVRIDLWKQIPSAAGLGGGSSDAATTLIALNALHDGPFSSEALLQFGIELGSDVPFFLGGSPLALAWSRGERLLALPALPPRPVLIAHPDVSMPTGEAFQRIAELRGGGYEPRARRISLEELSSWESIESLATNDFEEPADQEIATLAPARRRMRQAGARIALLAGSGSSIFGIFPDVASRDLALIQLAADGFATWSADTLDVLPSVDRSTPRG